MQPVEGDSRSGHGAAIRLLDGGYPGDHDQVRGELQRGSDIGRHELVELCVKLVVSEPPRLEDWNHSIVAYITKNIRAFDRRLRKERHDGKNSS